MKKLILIPLMLLALFVTGCGGSEDDTKQNQVAGAPIVSPINGQYAGQQRIPAIPGGYCTSTGQCGNCPVGYTQDSQGCFYSGSQVNCGQAYGQGYGWNTSFNNCLPQQFGCPAGTTFDYRIGRCLSQQPVNYDPAYFRCGYLYYNGVTYFSCGYIYGAPHQYSYQGSGSHWYYNGYRWVRW